MHAEQGQELEGLEVRLLLEGIYQHYGYDFRNYAAASIRRRILKSMSQEGLQTVSSLQERILHDSTCFERFLHTISVDVTSLFRDPSFYRALRQKVLPELRSVPFIRVWHAGCSTGEEVYSMAILLQEEGLYGKTRIYATDMDNGVLKEAKEGIYPLSVTEEFEANHLQAGGKGPLSQYYRAKYDNLIFRKNLKKNIVWAQHNLVTDQSFNEFHLILCRNVMIYFNPFLQEQVHRLLYGSLAVNGVLGLGSKESLALTPLRSCYGEVNGKEKLFRRVK